MKMIAAFNFMILVGLIAPWKDLLLFKGLLSLTTSLELVSAKVNCESKLSFYVYDSRVIFQISECF